MKTEMILFDIQRNSVVDGPGLRTTVFFKGCNLRCAWCHNPEGQAFEKELMFFSSRCTGCGMCVKKCPTGGTADKAKCTLCGTCAFYCLNEARRLCGKTYTVDEVMDILRKDRSFYENSGGGVTFSGGECLLQADALTELEKKCKAENIRTAVDTAGNVPFAVLEQVLPYTDLFLYDVKAVTPALHRALTGVDNRLILQNLQKLCARGAAVTVRVPVIGGANDDPAEMQKIAAFLKPLPLQKIELLPYHGMGENKYAALGKPLPGPFHTPERFEAIRQLF